MGNQAARTVAGVNQVVGALIGSEMLQVLKTAIQAQEVFKTIFGEHIFVNEIPAYNETILPAWEMRFDKETIEGSDKLHQGTVNTRILFPNNLNLDLTFHRKLVLTIARFLHSDARLNDVLRKVSGLTEIGETLDITYDTMFVHGAMKVPSIIIRFPFILDVRRFRLENPEIPLDEDLDQSLLRDWRQRLEVFAVDEVTEDKIKVLEGDL